MQIFMREEQHKQILTFLRTGDYFSVKKILSDIEQDSLDDSDYWYYSAHVARKTGDLTEAEKFCKKAILLSPNLSDINFELGIIYQSMGDYKKSVEYIKKVVDSFSEQTTLTEKIDTLNSLALTYKMARDTDNAFRYYNLALESIAQEIYENIKRQPLESIDFTHAGSPDEGWMRLAFQIAVKNTAKDGIENILVPDGETAVKLLQQNSLMGIAMYDKDGSRYLLPAYFSAFVNTLKQNIWYSTITNNIGMLYADTGEIRKAGETFMESIDFIPSDSNYNAPVVNFSDLQTKYGSRYWEVK